MNQRKRISNVEKYQILLQPTMCTADIMLFENCGQGTAIKLRVAVENYILDKGSMLPAKKHINTWAYMEVYGLSYAQFERLPDVAHWVKENM